MKKRWLSGICAAVILLCCGCAGESDGNDKHTESYNSESTTAVTEPSISTETEATVPATECEDDKHQWGEPTYTWINDNTACVAQRTCTVPGCNEVETETTTVTVQTVTDEEGEPSENQSHVEFEQEGFEEQTTVETLSGTEPVFLVTDASGYPGEEISVEIWIENNPGIIAAALDVHYDAQKLKLVSSEDSGLLKGGFFSESVEKDPYYVSWNDPLAAENNTDDGILVNLVFQILEGAEGETEISLTYNPGNVFDWDLNNVTFSTAGGTVEILVD